MRNATSQMKANTHPSFTIQVHFDGDEISAIVKTIDVNRFAVWMNDQYKFSVAQV